MIATVSGDFVTGVRADNVWSFAGDASTRSVDRLGIDPLVNWNFGNGWTFVSYPSISADWEAKNDRWSMTLGGGFARTFAIGRQAMTADLQAYKEVIQKRAGWSLRFGLHFFFPV